MQPSERTPEEHTALSTSRSLLARLHTNDPDAWERLVALYAPLVWDWCRQMDLARQDMADVFQEVFKAVAVHIRTFHKDRPGDTFRGWLRTITRNKVHDHFRLMRREPKATGGTDAQLRWSQLPQPQQGHCLPLPDADLDEEPAQASANYQRLFQRALALIQAEFEERTWRAFWLVVVDGRRPHDVAQELTMSPGAVRVAKCRVLHRLRQELGDLAR